MKQYTITGELEEIIPPEPQKRFKTMQEQFGIREGKTCKSCYHCRSIEYSKKYYKCELWRLSHSAATDIRLKNQACGKYLEDKQC